MPQPISSVSGPVKSYTAETLMSRGYAVTFGATVGGATAITVAGQRSIGVLQEDVLIIGCPAAVAREGDSFAVAGGVVNTGDYVKADALGRLVTIAGTPGEEIVGRAESAAAGVGDTFVIFVLPSVR